MTSLPKNIAASSASTSVPSCSPSLSPRLPGRRASDAPARADVQAMATCFAASRDPQVRDAVVVSCQKYVGYLAARLRRGDEPLEDLIQVGTLGLIRALDGYDPERGTAFLSYASPSIAGEIRHYLRDKTWHVQVPRALRERLFAVQRAEKALHLRHGRSPTVTEVAAALSLSEEAVLEAMELGRTVRAVSLDAVVEGLDGERSALAERVGAPDAALHDLVVYQALGQALRCLSPREQEIIRLRFFEELSQEEIAEQVSLSQMHVSRLLRRALDRLQGMLGE